MGDVDELRALRDQIAELERVRDSALRLLDLLEGLALIKDDSKRGRALLEAMRTQPLFAVPRTK